MILQTTLVSHAVEATVAVHGTTNKLHDKMNMMIKTMKLRLNFESKIPPEKNMRHDMKKEIHFIKLRL